MNNINPMISLNSFLQLSFSPFSYKLVFDLIKYTRKLIEFLNFRSNITFNKIKLYFEEGDRFSYVGDVYYVWQPEMEIKPIKSNRFINYELINGSIEKIYTDLISNNLYLRHVPKTFHESQFIDPARFILDVTAFEWEYRLNFPEKEPENENHLKIKSKVKLHLEDRINKTTGYEKNLYKKLVNNLMKNHVSLETKIRKFYEKTEQY